MCRQDSKAATLYLHEPLVNKTLISVFGVSFRCNFHIFGDAIKLLGGNVTIHVRRSLI